MPGWRTHYDLEGILLDVETEARLVARLQQRDPEAFAIFFDAQVDRVYRLGYSVMGNREDADEVVQATFIAAYDAIERFEPHARLATWLYRIAYHHCLMLLRQRHPTEALPDEDGALPQPAALVDWSAWPESVALDAEAHAVLQSAIATLPPLLRAAFVLRDVEQIPTAECAHVQGISESACKVRLHRARLLLRERLGEYFGDRIATPHAAGAPQEDHP